MEWTRKLRYKKLNEWTDEEREKVCHSTATSPWRLGYHIQPESGLLNDPNGFSYFNDAWHLFYQNFPMGPVHGIKCWYHLISQDLIHWHEKGLALIPDNVFDSHGCYSGSALPIDNRLLIMYTGNVRDVRWNRHSYQMGAWMDNNNHVAKIKKPLIDHQPENYTDHFRDPQIIHYEKAYYILLGAQHKSLSGKILIYKSTNLDNWHFLGPLHFANQSLGYMIECPNLVFIDGTPVLIFCPQGLDKSILNYDNVYPNTYLIGDQFTPEVPEFSSDQHIHNLDDGFDSYATQAFNSPDGRVLAVSWIGLPEIVYPTDTYGWAHCLSLVRQLTIKNNHLYQYPVEETCSMRSEEISRGGELNNQTIQIPCDNTQAYELAVKLKGSGSTILCLSSDGVHSLDLVINFQKGELILDRGHAGVAFAEEYGTTRKTSIPSIGELELTIFMDCSAAEIYVNHGYKVLTTRFFPNKNQVKTFLKATSHLDYNYHCWRLSKG